MKTTDAPDLPGSFQLDGGFFYEIFTTAGYTSPITICLPIASLPQPCHAADPPLPGRGLWLNT